MTRPLLSTEPGPLHVCPRSVYPRASVGLYGSQPLTQPFAIRGLQRPAVFSLFRRLAAPVLHITDGRVARNPANVPRMRASSSHGRRRRLRRSESRRHSQVDEHVKRERRGSMHYTCTSFDVSRTSSCRAARHVCLARPSRSHQKDKHPTSSSKYSGNKILMLFCPKLAKRRKYGMTCSLCLTKILWNAEQKSSWKAEKAKKHCFGAIGIKCRRAVLHGSDADRR